MDTLSKLKKFAEGGKVRKYSTAGELPDPDVLLDEVEVTASYSPPKRKVSTFNTSIDADPIDPTRVLNAQALLGTSPTAPASSADAQTILGTDLTALEEEKLAKIQDRRAKRQARHQNLMEGFGGEDMVNTGNNFADAASNFGSGNWKAGATLLAAGAATALDSALMGDKNFGAQSQAIDGAVHAASSALMQSGNPYAMIAGAALEGANFLTKAGGQTVQGFDVDIQSSGYGDMGHMESSSSRDFGAMIGLGGLNQGKMKAKLAKRNAQARMAMNAAEIANELAFELEARANSIQNTIMNNNIALAGGLETSLLGG